MLFLAPDEADFTEGAVGGLFEGSGATITKIIPSPDEPKRDGGEILVVRVTFTPKDGADPEYLAGVRELIVSCFMTAATKENGYCVADVRWGAAALTPEEGK